VDLTDPANSQKSKDARLIERVFKSAEADLIFSSPDPDQTLWSIWACKEAAFKAISKAEKKKRISSSPLKYSVSLDLSGPGDWIARARARMFRGSVITPAGSVPLRLVRNSNYVHALASTGADDAIGSAFWTVCKVNLNRSDITADIQSMLVRRAVKTKVAGYVNADPKDLEIVRPKKNDSSLGPPVLLVGGKQSSIDISLSHDGVYLAYAFLLSG